MFDPATASYLLGLVVAIAGGFFGAAIGGNFAFAITGITVLTLTGPASMFPAGIVGILRFFLG